MSNSDLERLTKMIDELLKNSTSNSQTCKLTGKAPSSRTTKNILVDVLHDLSLERVSRCA